MMARTVEKITSLARVEIEENPGHDNNLLFETGLEKVQSVRDGVWEAFEIEPQVEGRVRYSLDLKAHVSKTLDNVITFFLIYCQRVHK